jgi:Zn-ribbon RNA-binding protein
MEKKLACSSCKKEVTNDKSSTIFKCPKCGNSDIIRCKHCKEIATRYNCNKCDFSGPN